MRMNPITRKELKLGARSIRFPLALLLYSGILALGALMALSNIINGLQLDFYGTNLSSVTDIFTLLAFGQLVMVCVMIPVMTGGSIAGERERQTLDIMLTTPVKPWSMVTGKLWAAMVNMFMFVISSLPAMTLAFIYGGLEWRYLFIFLLEIMCVAFFNGALGIWCSAKFKKTVLAVIMTLVFEAVFYGLTIMAVVAVYTYESQQILSDATVNGVITGAFSTVNLGWIPAVLLLNPAVGFTEAMMMAVNGSGVLHSLFHSGTALKFDVDEHLLQLTDYWVIISLLVTLILGLFFIKLAARKIDATRRKEKHVRVKRKRRKKENGKSKKNGKEKTE